MHCTARRSTSNHLLRGLVEWNFLFLHTLCACHIVTLFIDTLALSLVVEEENNNFWRQLNRGFVTVTSLFDIARMSS